MYDTGVISGGWVARGDSDARSCNCVGPRNGQPLCPCQMRGVEIRNGRYVLVQDLGPVSKCDKWQDASYYIDVREPN